MREPQPAEKITCSSNVSLEYISTIHYTCILHINHYNNNNIFISHMNMAIKKKKKNKVPNTLTFFN